MKRLSRLLMVSALFLASALSLASFPLLAALSPAEDRPALKERVRLRLAEAFEAVAEAERLGGDVSGLVDELNQALILLEEAEIDGDKVLLQEAISRVEDVAARAPVVGRAGMAAAQARTVQSWLVVGVVAALGVIVWRYEPRFFWRLWVWSRRKWKVKP